MHYVITFTTSRFDVTREDENPINPIYGQSLLLWLQERVRDTVEIGRPETEDWGWYVDIKWQGRTYMLGASTEDSLREPSGEYFWFFQIVYHRSLKQWLIGRGKADEDDCVQFFKSVLESESAFHNVTIDW